jgi:RNA polymerase sigma factor (sigma-70 family)
MIATIERADPALEIAFSRLDRKTRDVLMLSALQGLDVDQIATRLRISRRRVRQYLRQAIDAIADAVDPSEP